MSLLCDRCSLCPALIQPKSQEFQEPDIRLRHDKQLGRTEGCDGACPSLGEREWGHDEGGREATAKTLLSISIAGSFLLPSSDLLGTGIGPWGGPRVLRGHPRGCPLTMPPWLAVLEVPNAEGAVPMALLPVSLP